MCKTKSVVNEINRRFLTESFCKDFNREPLCLSAGISSCDIYKLSIYVVHELTQRNWALEKIQATSLTDISAILAGDQMLKGLSNENVKQEHPNDACLELGVGEQNSVVDYNEDAAKDAVGIEAVLEVPLSNEQQSKLVQPKEKIKPEPKASHSIGDIKSGIDDEVTAAPELNVISHVDPDGPCGNRQWRHNGKETTDKMQIAPWRICKYLSVLKDKSTSFDNLYEAATGDQNEIDFDFKSAAQKRVLSILL